MFSGSGPVGVQRPAAGLDAAPFEIDLAAAKDRAFGRRRAVPIHRSTCPSSSAAVSQRVTTTAAAAAAAARPAIDQMTYDQVTSRQVAVHSQLQRAEAQLATLRGMDFGYLESINPRYAVRYQEYTRLCNRLTQATIEGDQERVREVREQLIPLYAELMVMDEVIKAGKTAADKSQFPIFAQMKVADKTTELRATVTRLQVESSRLEARRAEFKRRDVIAGAAEGGTRKLARAVEGALPESGTVAHTGEVSLAESFWTYRLWAPIFLEKNKSDERTPLETLGLIVRAIFLSTIALISDAIAMFADETIRSLLWKQIVSGTVAKFANNAVDQALNERNMDKLVGFATTALERVGMKITVEAVTILQDPTLHKAIVKFAKDFLENQDFQRGLGSVLTGRPLRKAVSKAIGHAAGDGLGALRAIVGDKKLLALVVEFVSRSIEGVTTRGADAAKGYVKKAAASATPVRWGRALWGATFGGGGGSGEVHQPGPDGFTVVDE
ncbi:hypothetical protein K0U07_05580 [bacterium]|nr:hypothetical protein [bacterium]